MKSKAEREMKAEFNRCQSVCRKKNVHFDPDGFRAAWGLASRHPDLFSQQLEVHKSGLIYPVRK